MSPATRRSTFIMATILLGCSLVFGLAGTAQAEKKAKSVQTEAIWVGFDAANKTITAKVMKPGRQADLPEAMLKRGNEATFDVIPEGSVLARTSVAVNGKKGELSEIPEGKTVLIYWVADESKATKRFARKIDIIFSEEELRERYGFDD